MRIGLEEGEALEELTTLPVRRSAGIVEDERTGAALEDDEAEVTSTCLPLRRWVAEEMEEDMRMSVSAAEKEIERENK